MDPFDRDLLKKHTPHPSLVARLARLSAERRKRRTLGPDAGMHNLPHVHMMENLNLGAREHLGARPLGNRTAVVLGAGECADVPLETLAGDGRVYLVDVDVESLRSAKGSLEETSLQERVSAVCMDASLFETTLLERAEALLVEYRPDIDRAFGAILAMHADAAEQGGLFAANELPIRRGSVDLAISSMTLTQFMIGYLQTLMELFLDVLGRGQTRRYLLPEGASSEEGLVGEGRITKLQRSLSSLAQQATQKHIHELCRIVTKGGVVIFSDHALQGRCTFISDQEVEVNTRSLGPYSKDPEEERVLRYREDPERPLPGFLTVDVTTPDRIMTTEGADALKTVLARDGRAHVLNEQGWWWVTERLKDVDRTPPTWRVSYVEAFVLTSKKDT